MKFEEDLIAQIAQEPIVGVTNLVEEVRARLSSGQGWTDDDHELLGEALALLHAAREADLISLPVPLPEVSGDLARDCQTVYSLLDQIFESYKLQAEKQKYESNKAKYSASLGVGHFYEFSQGDLDRIQSLLNELRGHISVANFIDPDHKRRLMARLEKLQSELHKKVSNLDRFWGLVGETGVVLGKFGNDAKPIVDRIREIAQIVWSTQARMEELPSSSPFPVLTGTALGEDGPEEMT